MGKKDFEKFLNKEKKGKAETSINPDERIEEFKSHVNHLYHLIEDEWLAEFINQEKVEVTKQPIELYEELLGHYTMDQLLITIANQTALMEPIGTILIGTKGRVDLKGPADKVRFILTDKATNKPKVQFHEVEHEEASDQVKERPDFQYNKSQKLVWKIATDPPNVQYIDLDQDAFLDNLMAVING